MQTNILQPVASSESHASRTSSDEAVVCKELLGCVQEIADELVKSGIITSFVYGPSAGIGIIWSVDVLTESGESFDKPYGANSLRQAAEIARHECEKRGWHVAS